MDTKNKRVAYNRLSQEQVIKQFKEVHGDEFDYSNVVYVDINTPVEVYCKKHDFIFTPTPKNHRNGSKCKNCGKENQIEKSRKTNEQFIKQLSEKYGNKYDYSLIEYNGNKIPVKIVYKDDIIEMRPDALLFKKKTKGFIKKLTKSSDKETFIEEAVKVYGNKDDYTETYIISARKKIKIRCTKHDNTFQKDIQTYLQGYGCPKCSAENYRKLRTIPIEEYYKRAEKANDYKYTYTGDYTILKEAITFYCKEHGRQRRNASSHLNGTGCMKCEKTGNKTDKFTKEGYINTANERVTSLYLIECSSEKEKFYKIGKTFRGVEARFSGKILPYQYKVLKIYNSTAEEIWDLEESLHIKYKDYSYKSDKWFSGFSECYNMDLPIKEIIKL